MHATRERAPVGDMSWTALNDFLRDATEQECLDMLREEKLGKFRPMIVARIFCRFNKTRSMRERREMLEPIK